MLPMDDQYDYIDLEQQQGVLEITMTGDELNSLTPELDEELQHVFMNVVDQSDAKVAVLTGEGKAFSAGGNLEWVQKAIDNPRMFQESLHDSEKFIKHLLNMDTPTIAKVNGDAIGGGVMLLLYCDLAIASEDARIADGHTPIGLSAGDGGVPVWPFYTNIRKAKEYMFTGEPIPAPEAEEMGLINYAVPADELDAKVEEFTVKISNGPQTAIRYTKKSLNTWLEFGVNLTLRESMALELLTQQQEDHAAAVNGFLEGQRLDEIEFPSAQEDWNPSPPDE